jgi:hypothetical protein
MPDMINPQKGIDLINNDSINKYNTLCSYNISILPLKNKGILQHHQEREREGNNIILISMRPK